MTARPEKLRVAFQEFDLEFRRGCRSAELADEPAAEPQFRELVLLHVEVARAHGAGAQVQPLGRIVTNPAHDRFVCVTVAQQRVSAVLHRQDVLKLLPPSVKFDPFVHAPEITQRM